MTEGERSYLLMKAVERGVILALCAVGEAYAETQLHGAWDTPDRPRSALGKAFEALAQYTREEAQLELNTVAVLEVEDEIKELGHQLDPNGFRCSSSEASLTFILKDGSKYPVTVDLSDYGTFPSTAAFLNPKRVREAELRQSP
jgi:hypothetical protein